MRRRIRNVNGGDELIVVEQLRRDVDLGLHMAERLTVMGEVGSARRIIAELAGEADRTARSMPGRARARTRRSTIVSLSLVAALGATSAAAIVSGPDSQSAKVRDVAGELPTVPASTISADGDGTSANSGVSISDDQPTTSGAPRVAGAGTRSGDVKPTPAPGGPIVLPFAPPPLELPDLPDSEVRSD